MRGGRRSPTLPASAVTLVRGPFRGMAAAGLDRGQTPCSCRTLLVRCEQLPVRSTRYSTPRTNGTGRMPTRCIWSPEDGVLGLVAPLAAASVHETALVVDLDPAGLRYPGPRSLARLVDEGPQRSDLMPQQCGVAVLPNGGIDAAAAMEVLQAIIEGWPAVVVRLPPRPVPVSGSSVVDWPVVPVLPLLPRAVMPASQEPSVYQRSGWTTAAPGPGVVLPRPRRSTLTALMNGVRPSRDRWLRRWREIWGPPWG